MEHNNPNRPNSKSNLLVLKDSLEFLEDVQRFKDGCDSNQLSKRKRKRLLREQKWLEQKKERKRYDKERRRANKKISKDNKQSKENQKKQRIERVKMCQSKCQVSIVIDCDYETYMNDYEIKKLCKQLNRCYALNRHSLAPVQLWITSIHGKIGQFLDRLQPGHHRWDCHCTNKHWSEIFFDQETSQRLIYLTGDSSETIPNCQQIQQSNKNVFIIGGIIDHNRHKGLSLQRAVNEFKVKHGQLPISDYIKMSQCRILSIPHVFEIMLFASNGTIGNNWSEIFKKVIPSRKLNNNKQN